MRPKQGPVVRSLLEHGAKVDHVADTGRTLLLCSALNDQCDHSVLKELIELTKAAGMSIDLPCVPRSLKWKLIFFIMTRKYRKGSRNNLVTHIAMLNESTPLMAAARRGDAKAVRILLQAGADRTMRNAIGLNALSISRVYGPFPDVDAILSEDHPSAPATMVGHMKSTIRVVPISSE